MSTHYDEFLIGGRWTAPSSNEEIVVVSPNDGQPLGTVAAGVHADIDAAVDAARAAFDAPDGWPNWPADKRAAAMETLADALDRRGEQIAQTVSTQNGMPVAIASQLEAVFPQVLLRYYAQLACAEEFSTVRPGLLGGQTTITRTPVGVVGAIIPWNFPQVLSAFKYAPGLAAGCTFVIKPAPETVFDAALFAEAVAESDIPPGVINVVPGGRETGAYLVSHPGIDKVAFTGSTQVGREIATVCGGLLRPVTLELGGKSAAIILDDADLDLSVIGEKLFAATLLNNGQTCFIGTRILAPRSRYAEVVDVVTALAGSLAIGNSLDPTTQIGPLVSSRQRDRVEAAIAQAASSGARLTTGGIRPVGLDAGWFVAPTVFADVSNDSPIAQEEIFGPVLAVIGYDDDEDAVRIANANTYGLGGSVWTTDPQRGLAVAKRVRSGTVGINHYLPDPTAPFGGVKASGLGRELGPEGLAAYLETKSIYQPAG